jgi:hypothetical protein
MNQISVDRQFLVDISNACANIDDKLASLAGSPTAGKRAQIKALVEANETDVTPVVTFVESLQESADRFVVWSKIEAAIKAKFDAEFDAFVASLVKVEATPGEKISDDEVEALITKRRQYAQQWAALTSVWPSLMPGVDISDIPAPKKMTGSRGPRGKRAISSYQFSLDGGKLSADENSLVAVAKKFNTTDAEGNFVPWKAKGLRDFCIEQAKQKGIEFSWKTPPSEFTFELPGGRMFSGVKMEEPEIDDSDDDSDD